MADVAAGTSVGRLTARRLLISGTVQGVGFRPSVYRAARRLQLCGWVRNAGQQVEVLVQGEAAAVAGFERQLSEWLPTAARVERVWAESLAVAEDLVGFEIVASAASDARETGLTPDLALCAACRAELFDPAGRRYRYPFINCTQCGPRYSIVRRVPYDRAQTTMERFVLCSACRGEYEDAGDRRFHAQPNACAVCGPMVAAWDANGQPVATAEAALTWAVAQLQQGRILAVKGLGGFHLMVDATDAAAVQRLRERKRRPWKPLAVMCASVEEVARHVDVTADAAALLGSAAAPIVLLPRRVGAEMIVDGVAPGQPELGCMVAYTPLHALLLESVGRPLVATSGNRSDEPMCTDEAEVVARLGAVADGYLVHDRPIARPVDDSVARLVAGAPVVLRRARGLAPLGLLLGRSLPAGETGVATGAHQKNTVGLALGTQAVLSPHVGDLDGEAAQRLSAAALRTLFDLHGVKPDWVACDRHPEYASTRLAESLGVPVVRVQHHHAHVAAVLAEHGEAGPVCGLAWDGTGWGDDGTIWGGECVRATCARMERRGALRAFALPGGDAAARQPCRVALGALHAVLGDAAFERTDVASVQAVSEADRRVLRQMLGRGVRSPLTSSMGRLFDVVASVLDVCQVASCEGEAAMRLEAAAGRGAPADDRGYDWAWDGAALDWGALLLALIDDRRAGVPVPVLARSFHTALARAAVAMADRVGLPVVVLGGGCFQNALLLALTVDALRAAGYRPLWPRQAPPNDGGLAYGQLVVAAAQRVEQGE